MLIRIFQQLGQPNIGRLSSVSDSNAFCQTTLSNLKRDPRLESHRKFRKRNYVAYIECNRYEVCREDRGCWSALVEISPSSVRESGAKRDVGENLTFPIIHGSDCEVELDRKP